MKSDDEDDDGSSDESLPELDDILDYVKRHPVSLSARTAAFLTTDRVD